MLALVLNNLTTRAFRIILMWPDMTAGRVPFGHRGSRWGCRLGVAGEPREFEEVERELGLQLVDDVVPRAARDRANGCRASSRVCLSVDESSFLMWVVGSGV